MLQAALRCLGYSLVWGFFPIILLFHRWFGVTQRHISFSFFLPFFFFFLAAIKHCITSAFRSVLLPFFFCPCRYFEVLCIFSVREIEGADIVDNNLTMPF